jgi:hypothetical protein
MDGARRTRLRTRGRLSEDVERTGGGIVDNVKLGDWIGKDVGVHWVEGSAVKKPMGGGTLKSADERGIMLSYHDADDLSQRFFFPWHRIEWIHRLTQ